ncbi:MAG: hypothetical protein KY457_05730 [Actinobacteria bacterium]|nr:hypothetical protein [Actinomycetota bacterium]
MTVRLAVEAWAPEYGSSMGSMGDPGAGSPASTANVDVNVEVDARDWTPRTPSGDAAEDVLFIDGVQRVDAQVWITDDDGTRLGHAASYAAGTVRCDGHAGVEACEVRRSLIAPAGAPTLVTRAATYAPAAVAADDPDALRSGLQERRRKLEIAVANAGAAADLVVVDGPLSGRAELPNAIGYVKTHHVTYLPPLLADVVPQLGPGQRTPLFLTQTQFSRYAWYLRLPHGAGHPWAGVVRGEASGDVPLDEAVRLADLSAATLPRFASQPHKDGRAPQNLYPIAGLERHLKRMLGDPSFLYRQLRAAVA